MINYIYDGTFEGLLTAIYDSYYEREVPNKIVTRESIENNFLISERYIETDKSKSDKVYDSVVIKISKQSLENVFYAFLSEAEDCEVHIYNYLKLGWKIGPNVDSYLTDDRVLHIHNLRRKVAREKHLMLGLIRFRAINEDLYYAPIEPEYNVLVLLAPHFVTRNPSQSFIIHDVKRNLGAVYNQKEWVITDISLKKDITYSDEEVFYQSLWKEYHKTIAIKNRINPKLQKRNMPMKYWKYLIEKEG